MNNRIGVDRFETVHAISWGITRIQRKQARVTWLTCVSGNFEIKAAPRLVNSRTAVPSRCIIVVGYRMCRSETLEGAAVKRFALI